MIYVLSGGTSLYAVIAVTYPSGSICTCGGKAAKDTSGYALFNVKAGTYTVECHTSDNSKSKSTSVTVAEGDKGKVKSVKLSYAKYLIQNGAPTDITGGFTSGATSSGVFVISAPKAGANYTVESKSNNSISRESYKTLKFDGYIKDAGDSYAKYGTASVKITSTSRKTVELDISSISSGKISLEFLVLTETSYSYMYVYNLWLE